jgi:predicted ribosome quality control (RQC) complex YloA/Tae2 family protein
MKTRFTSFDVGAAVKCLRSSLIGMRVANVYDLNPKTYLIKLAKPDKKVFLLIESGIRIHTTDFAREKSNIPSVFTLKV